MKCRQAETSVKVGQHMLKLAYAIRCCKCKRHTGFESNAVSHKDHKTQIRIVRGVCTHADVAWAVPVLNSPSLQGASLLLKTQEVQLCKPLVLGFTSNQTIA